MRKPALRHEPASRRTRPRDLRQGTVGQGVEAGQDGGPRGAREIDARAFEPGIRLERVVLEADDHPRGPWRHDVARRDAGRELDDVVRCLAAPLTFDRCRRNDAIRPGDADVGMDQSDLGCAPVAQRQQRRRTQERERLRGLRPGAAQPEAA
jgi:hypothetical protein